MAISISFSQQLHSPRDQLLSSSSQPSNCRRLFFKFSPLSPPLGHTSLSSRLHCLSSAVPRSTYCSRLYQHREALRRAIHVVNYPVAMDIRELVSLDDVMEELGFGPNGGLTYCMDHPSFG
ncbi:uncharacterized protein A4U43_C02F3410, partial [Asparagus officinalis]